MARSRSEPEQPPDDRFVQSIAPSTEELPRARRDFSRWLEQRRVARRISGELAIVFSELTANAVNAAEKVGRRVQARAWCEGPELVLEVVNPSPGSSKPTRRWDLDDQLRSGGRGLQIVHALVDSVESGGDGQGRVVVRCRRSIDADA